MIKTLKRHSKNASVKTLLVFKKPSSEWTDYPGLDCVQLTTHFFWRLLKYKLAAFQDKNTASVSDIVESLKYKAKVNAWHSWAMA